MEHDILKLQISMDYQNSHHIVKSVYELIHYFLDDLRFNFPLFELHELFKIATIAKLHEYVISRVCLDCLSQFDNIFAVDRILILDLINNQVLLGPAQILPLDHFTSV